MPLLIMDIPNRMVQRYMINSLVKQQFIPYKGTRMNKIHS